MASEEYNMIIVNDGDALPPNPIYTQTEEFLRPAAYPNEWGCHEAFAKQQPTSPLPTQTALTCSLWSSTPSSERYYDLFLNGLISAEEAGVEFAGEIERALEENLAKRPVLAREFEEQVQIQQQIDALKAAGQPIPREWVTNPFYLKYYEDRGLLK
jgi:multiple sugar transport system substrate-binding protein